MDFWQSTPFFRMATVTTVMDTASLCSLAKEVRSLRPNIDCYTLASGKEIFLLARGNPINLAAGDGNPIEVMDLGLALQSLSLEYTVKHGDQLSKLPQTVPYEIETEVAKAALAAWTYPSDYII